VSGNKVTDGMPGHTRASIFQRAMGCELELVKMQELAWNDKGGGTGNVGHGHLDYTHNRFRAFTVEDTKTKEVGNSESTKG
jgi:hypothetical protein